MSINLFAATTNDLIVVKPHIIYDRRPQKWKANGISTFFGSIQPFSTSKTDFTPLKN